MRIAITGANRGIGAALADLAERQGHEVIRHGRSAGDIRCDLSDPAAIAAAFGALDGPLDCLVNNEGIIGPAAHAADPLDAQAAQRTFAVNTLAPLAVAQAVLPALRRAKAGRIVNLSSQMSWMGYAKSDHIAYRAFKAALNKVMQGLATDLAPDGIAVVLVDPGWVRTDMGGAQADEDPRDVAAGILRIAQTLTPADSGKFLRFTGEERAF